MLKQLKKVGTAWLILSALSGCTTNINGDYLMIVTHKSAALFSDADKDKRKILDRFISPTCMIELPENNCNKLKENTRHISMLEEVLLRKLKESDLDFICNTNVNHIPGNISLSFKGISGETLMHRLDLKGIMVSTGSACDSAKNQISHVIKALGVPEDYAYGTIRISLGKENTEDEIEEIFIAINEIVKSLTV